MDVSIVIVTYNSLKYITPCFDSIKKFCQALDYEIIVVDNCSTDGTVELIRSNYPEVLLQVNQQNVGFGAANNQATRFAQGDFLFLLNADTQLLDKHLEDALRIARAQGIAVIGPKTFNAEWQRLKTCDKQNSLWRQIQTILSMAFFVAKFKKLFYFIIFKNIPEQYYESPEEVSFLVGSAMLIERKVVEKYGLFDEQFFFTGEERDMCMRYHAHGEKMIYLPGWAILHHVGSETPQSCFHIINWIKSTHLLARKHGATVTRMMMRCVTAFYLVSYSLAFALKAMADWKSRDKRLLSIDYLLMDLWYFGFVTEEWVYSYSKKIRITS